MTSPSELVAHLVRRGLLPPGSHADVVPLTGGVSNDVYAVSAPGVGLVVKRALARLRVEEEWRADAGRLDIEARALRLAAWITPDAVPAVLDMDDGFLVVAHAPADWTNWRDDLLAGDVRPAVAARLGGLLGTWQRATADTVTAGHTATAGHTVMTGHTATTGHTVLTGHGEGATEYGEYGEDARNGLGDRTLFRQLRVDPFYLTVRDRRPEVAEHVQATVDAMLAARVCLVHGDFTPKNVLVSPRPPTDPMPGTGVAPRPELWVLDWETAHVGDPTFDPASTLTHLLLKSVHRSSAAEGYAVCARALLDARAEAASGAVVLDPAQLVRQTGCFLLARVDGKSPARYLRPPEQEKVRELGRSLLLEPPGGVLEAWKRLS